jgi:hypothetical protein
MIYNAVLYLLCIHVMGCYNDKIKCVHSLRIFQLVRSEINKVSKYRSGIYSLYN